MSGHGPRRWRFDPCFTNGPFLCSRRRAGCAVLVHSSPRSAPMADAGSEAPEAAAGAVAVAVSVESLTKRYGGVTAVDGLSFSVHAGEIFGLLGPNGAGKTTTVEIVEGLREADAGRVQ